MLTVLAGLPRMVAFMGLATGAALLGFLVLLVALTASQARKFSPRPPRPTERRS